MTEDSQPTPGRVGLVVMEAGRPIEHYCAVCGTWDAWGYGVDPAAGKPGRRFCSAHRPDGAR